MENSVSSKDAEEEHVMHSSSDSIKFASYNDPNEVADQLFESLRSRYQNNLETTMKGSNFILIQFTNITKYKIDVVVHVLTFQTGWKRKKTTINPEDENDKCFQYGLTVALTYRDIE